MLLRAAPNSDVDMPHARAACGVFQSHTVTRQLALAPPMRAHCMGAVFGPSDVAVLLRAPGRWPGAADLLGLLRIQRG